jgi:hypothetical protein
MSATVMVHAAFSPVAKMANEATTWLHFPTECGGYVAIFMPMHVAEAMVAAFNAASVPGYDALIGLIEELRDHKPEVISGRRRDPQDDTDDLMPLNEFEAFQADAEALVGKKRKVAP